MSQLYALKSVGHFLPGMAINIELTEERVKTLTEAGAITTKKPEKVVENPDKAKLAAKNVSAKKVEGKAEEDSKGDEGHSLEKDLEEARDKLKKNKRLTIPEIKLILDDEFITYDDELNHGELMKLLESDGPAGV